MSEEILEPPVLDDLPKYRFDSHVQKEILATLLHDRYFLIQAIGLVDPNYFVADSYKFVCKLLFDFFHQYNQQPQIEYLVEEIRCHVKDDQKKYRYIIDLREIDLIYEGNAVSRSYLLDKITEFAKQQAVRTAVYKICDLMKEGEKTNWPTVYDIFKQALIVAPNTDMGLDYFNEIEDFLDYIQKQEESTERFTSGFYPIDNCITGGGLSRGEIGAYVGLSGSGKSFALVQSAVQNIMAKKKVLYVSTEMDSYRLAQRFTSYFTFLSQEEVVLQANRQIVVEEVANRLSDITSDQNDKNRLRIKQFPPGTANIDDLRAYIAQLKLRGFMPDLFILDYVGELKDFPDTSVWESRQRLVRDLRGLGVEENICILTALQPNRQGRKIVQEGQVMDDAEIGDSYGQIRPLDACWSINQTREEVKAGVGKFFIMKHRHGRSKLELYFKRAKKTLAFEPISHHTYLNELTKVKSNQANASLDEITSLNLS
jgi:replicative DNA helicase